MRRLLLLVAGLFTLVVMISACGSAPPDRSQENVLTDVYVTAYTWFDNTPQGSPDISHPVLHRAAGGTGTFSDPVTIAVGHSLETGKDVLDVPAGTRMYIPNVRRYFIVEDTCGDGPAPEDGPCHSGVEEHGEASLWIDMWIGGEGGSESLARGCAEQVTGVRVVVFAPRGDYVVAPGQGVIHDGRCDSGYGDELLTR